MNALNRTRSCAALLALALSPLGAAGADVALPGKPEPQPQANQAVRPQIDKRTADATLEKHQQLIAEAQSAISETETALKAEALGDGAKKDYQPMYQQSDEIARKSAGGKSGMGWFDKIR